MNAHQRPTAPQVAPPLRTGDRVRVTYRNGSGPGSWAGVVTDVDDRLGLARITDGDRDLRVAVRGAAYVQVLVPASALADADTLRDAVVLAC